MAQAPRGPRALGPQPQRVCLRTGRGIGHGHFGMGCGHQPVGGQSLSAAGLLNPSSLRGQALGRPQTWARRKLTGGRARRRTLATREGGCRRGPRPEGATVRFKKYRKNGARESRAGLGFDDAEQAHYPSVSLSIESLFGQRWWAETARQRLL